MNSTSTFDKAQLAQLALLLERREAELLATAGELRSAIASPAEGAGAEVHDRVEDGDARMQSALELTQLGRQEGELQEVRAALRRLHDGSYGVCEECDEPIPLARLEARPQARLCLVHEEAWERAQQANR